MLGIAAVSDDAVIQLQRFDGDGGFTDIEMWAPDFHVIIEAKHGWNLPTVAQLARYAARTAACHGKRLLVSLTAASADFAGQGLPTSVAGVPVRHLSWTTIRAAARRAGKLARAAEERLWLRHLDAHLEGYVASQIVTSNMVYVVALSRAELASSYSWIDVVEKDNRYFHPYASGGGWPVAPPNYFGFRYDGRLQYVRHVDNHEVVTRLGDIDARWGGIEGANVVYRLGPPMRPAREVRTGRLFQAARVSCAIDTLLSGEWETISAARDETKRRNEAVE